MNGEKQYETICKYINSAMLVLLALYFLFIPGLLVVCYSTDSDIAGKGIPGIAWRLHKDLTPQTGGMGPAKSSFRQPFRLRPSGYGVIGRAAT